MTISQTCHLLFVCSPWMRQKWVFSNFVISLLICKICLCTEKYGPNCSQLAVPACCAWQRTSLSIPKFYSKFSSVFRFMQCLLRGAQYCVFITFSAGSSAALLRNDCFGYREWHEHSRVTLQGSNLLYEALDAPCLLWHQNCSRLAAS